MTTSTNSLCPFSTCSPSSLTTSLPLTNQVQMDPKRDNYFSSEHPLGNSVQATNRLHPTGVVKAFPPPASQTRRRSWPHPRKATSQLQSSCQKSPTKFICPGPERIVMRNADTPPRSDTFFSLIKSPWGERQNHWQCRHTRSPKRILFWENSLNDFIIVSINVQTSSLSCLQVS